MILPKKVVLGFFFLIIIGVVFILVVWPLLSPDKGEESSSSDSSSPQAAPASIPVLVKVVEAQRGPLIISLKTPGEAYTEKNIQIKAEVAGIVKAIHVREGQLVRGGQLLLELDDRPYQLDLESLEADRLRYLSELLLERQFSSSETSSSAPKEKLNKVEKEYNRMRQLFQKGMISKAEFERISHQYEMALIEAGEKKEEIRAAVKGLTQAEVRVKKARLDLEKTKIKAPFSGIIWGINVAQGQSINAGTELFSLVDVGQVKVMAKVLESEVEKVKVGREATLVFSAYPGKKFKGKVVAISPVIDPEERTCPVVISVANPKGEIKPGMHAEVEIAADIYEDCLLIPQEAILVRGGRKMAFVVEDGLAKWRYIQVGHENEQYAEVVDGIKEGETVIIEGHLTLAHDAPVKIVE
ncbi:MAG: efflux RND transporter periplasmic adaptor subunit [Candidatus Aminicenantes bacterium]|nr:MAG: efflux RND transporter periplasmic adaptor subunit [Candidatus Aminicenantes bacterium]